MIDINGCVCSKCDKWHSHVSQLKNGNWICINCKYKKNKVITNGNQNL